MTSPVVAGGLRMLGIDAERGRALPPLPLHIARRAARQLLPFERPPRYGICSSDLKSAGWGVVFVGGTDPAIKEALAPLLRLRQEQAGERYIELEAFADQTALEWRSALFAEYGRANPRQIPWYLLLVSTTGSTSFSFEHDLKPSYALGRLVFESVEDFAAYAERVVEKEMAGRQQAMAKAPARVGVLAPTHPSDAPTELCVEHFAGPMIEAATSRVDGTPRDDIVVDSALGSAATKARLETLLASQPNILITAGHGLLYPSEDPWQEQRQGALVCADWPGPEAAPRPIRAEESFAADDLPLGCLPGGMAIMLGCFTAGTPAFDLYDSLDLALAGRLAGSPFTSAMAGRMLGAEGSALAFLGHVGRAFEAGFIWRGVRQSVAFEDAIRAILDGKRLGEALDGLGHRFADLAVAWTRPHLDIDSPDIDPLDLWVAMNDARSWTLIGDPAVRLLPR